MREALRPTERRRIYDLVAGAGLDVTAWADYQRPESPSTNPAFCYEWAFVQESRIVLCIWHRAMQEQGDVVWQDLNYRTASLRHRDWSANQKKRAQAMDAAIYKAWKRKLSVRVVIVDGPPPPREGEVERRMLDAESWQVAEGRPLQFPPPDDRKLQRRPTALQIAVERRFHSLAGLLLANGYDPDGDYYECLSPAVRDKDHDMVDLLLRFGASPHNVDFRTVLETCDRALMDRFIDAGVDPCRDNAVAKALQSRGRPILGFVKQYRERFPELQRQIDIALRVATEAQNDRRIALMLWLGGNPHADVPATAYEDDHGSGLGDTAFESALWARKPEILTRFLKRPIPKESIQPLLFTVAHRSRPDLVRRLLSEGADPNALSEEGYPVLHGFISCLLWRYSSPSPEEQERGLEALELMLKAGARWSLDDRQLKGLRSRLAAGESKTVIRVLDLLHQYEAVTPEQLHELTRTPAVRKVLNGISKPRRDPFGTYFSPPPSPITPPPVEPAKPGYWKRHWSQR